MAKLWNDQNLSVVFHFVLFSFQISSPPRKVPEWVPVGIKRHFQTQPVSWPFLGATSALDATLCVLMFNRSVPKTLKNLYFTWRRLLYHLLNKTWSIVSWLHCIFHLHVKIQQCWQRIKMSGDKNHSCHTAKNINCPTVVQFKPL